MYPSETKAKAATPRLLSPKPKAGKRLAPRLRTEQIVRGAVRFFAEHGFSGQTRELANELGISNGLLYRYFPSKEALIDRVFEEVFLRRWNPNWQSIIADRSRPLHERLKVFYVDYSKLPLDYEWGRIYLHAGLAGASINQRYIRIANERIFKPVMNELRREFGAPSLKKVAMSEPELELVWSLHGSIFYIGIRKWVYHVKVPADIDAAIEQLVDRLYANARTVIHKTFLRKKRA